RFGRPDAAQPRPARRGNAAGHGTASAGSPRRSPRAQPRRRCARVDARRRRHVAQGANRSGDRIARRLPGARDRTREAAQSRAIVDDRADAAESRSRRSRRKARSEGARVSERELGRDATVAEVIVVACSASVERLLAHEDGVRRGDDPEDVHQARVATRRMRSDLRTFADFVFDPWATDLRGELRWLGGELGAVRDVEVLRDRLADHARVLPDDARPAAEHVIRRLDDEWERERAQLLETLASTRYEALRDLLVVAAARPRCTTWANLHAVDVLPRIVDRRWRKLDRGVSAIGEPPTDAALHEVRIRAKRARYATEAASP